MSPHDILEIPGHPGMYARRAFIDAWRSAGSPPLNDAGRLKWKQEQAWQNYQNGTGSPADNPARPDLFPLAHCRFVAGDITPTDERVRRLSAAGLVRPYKYEPWHWELPNVRSYAIVESLPTPASPTPATPATFPAITEIGDEMLIADLPNGSFLIIPQGNAKPRAVVLDAGSRAESSGIPRLKFETLGSREMLAAAVQF